MDKLDIKLWTLASKGQIVPDRSLLKTPEQIEMIKKSAALNTAVLDHVAAHIHAGMSTARSINWCMILQQSMAEFLRL